MNSLPMTVCQRRLGMLWIMVGGGILLLVALQSIFGHFETVETNKKVWDWLLPMIMPTFTLVVTVFGAQSFGTLQSGRMVPVFFYRITMGLSLAYLVLLSLLLFINFNPKDLVAAMEMSGIWLGAFQGVCIDAETPGDVPEPVEIR